MRSEQGRSFMSLAHTLRFIASHPLNAGRRPQALMRFARWQIASRMFPGHMVFEWINGAKMIVRPGETGFTQNIYCGLHEFSEMAYVLHTLTPDDFFVDVGANVGSYTILACAARGAKGYCFEPVPTTYRRLLDNVRLNDLTSRVVSLNIGLSDADGDLLFTTGENCTNHVLPAGKPVVGAERVAVQALDRVLENCSPNMIKIDVEGFETQVIKGALDTIAKPSLHSIIMELNGSGSRYGFDEGEIIKKLDDYGFSPYSYHPFMRELRPLAGKNNQSGNTLFIKDLDFVRERLANTPRVQVGSFNL
jgi:FkbM family methyltransferase